MNWRDVYPELTKKSKETCVQVALNCFQLAKRHTVDNFILDTEGLATSESRAVLRNRLARVCLIRANEPNLGPREAAHIMLHVIEAATSVNHFSAAGHAARCAEALHRIEPAACAALVKNNGLICE